MNKIVLTLSAIALVAACAGSAGAQCDFNTLAKAKGFKTSMVRRFMGCPSTEHTSINTATGGNTPACSPIMVKRLDGEATGYVLDPQKGSCDVQIQAKLEKDCSLVKDHNGDLIGLPAGPCNVTYVKSKCKGVFQAGGVTPINVTHDAGWSLSLLTRMTFNDATNGDMTAIDFPLTFEYGDPKNGQLELDTSIPESMIPAIPEFDVPAMPTCTTIQVIMITIKDPNGLPFATIGGSTRAADE